MLKPRLELTHEETTFIASLLVIKQNVLTTAYPNLINGNAAANLEEQQFTRQLLVKFLKHLEKL